MMKRDIVILGINGNSLDIAEAAECSGNRIQGFLDDDETAQGSTVGRWPVLGTTYETNKLPSKWQFVCGIGSSKSWRQKLKIIHRTGLPANRWATIIHPTAIVSSFSSVGEGCVLLAHTTLGARAILAPHCTLLQGSVVSHDTHIGAGSVLATGCCISGHCEVGQSVYFGCGSSVKQGISIGPESLVGMGSVVVKDVVPRSVVMGNPAKSRV